jgi:hypothetical protein
VKEYEEGKREVIFGVGLADEEGEINRGETETE